MDRSDGAASAAGGGATSAKPVSSVASSALHYSASCQTCSWSAEGPDADRAAHLHTTGKGLKHPNHSTRSGFHWSTDCERIHGWRGAWNDGTQGEW
jgi:hypothetical protein